MKKRITLLLALLLSAIHTWSITVNESNLISETNVTEINKKLTKPCACESELLSKILIELESTDITQESSFVKKHLAGEWGNNSAPVKVVSIDGNPEFDEAYLSFRFDSDGTYVKTLRSGNNKLSEIGIWDISKDGLYLVLHPETDMQEMPCEKSELIRIRYLELDELVLEQKVSSVSKGKFVIQNYYFNKR